jgi:NADH-quinone oxidoreductase subunit M
VYMLWMFQRVMFGVVTNRKNLGLSDLNSREILVLVPLLIFVVWIGVYPNTFLRPMEPAVKNFIQQVETKRAAIVNLEQAKKQAVIPGAEVGVKTAASTDGR